MNKPIESENELDEDEVEYEDCNCDDEFRTEMCPIHDITEPKKYIESAITITDDHMCPEMIVKWVGHAFICPGCSNYILHNFKYCAGCGCKVTIKSAIVTKVINNMADKNRK